MKPIVILFTLVLSLSAVAENTILATCTYSDTNGNEYNLDLHEGNQLNLNSPDRKELYWAGMWDIVQINDKANGIDSIGAIRISKDDSEVVVPWNDFSTVKLESEDGTSKVVCKKVATDLVMDVVTIPDIL